MTLLLRFFWSDLTCLICKFFKSCHDIWYMEESSLTGHHLIVSTLFSPVSFLMFTIKQYLWLQWERGWIWISMGEIFFDIWGWHVQFLVDFATPLSPGLPELPLHKSWLQRNVFSSLLTYLFSLNLFNFSIKTVWKERNSKHSVYFSMTNEWSIVYIVHCAGSTCFRTRKICWGWLQVLAHYNDHYLSI